MCSCCYDWERLPGERQTVNDAGVWRYTQSHHAERRTALHRAGLAGGQRQCGANDGEPDAVAGRGAGSAAEREWTTTAGASTACSWER